MERFRLDWNEDKTRVFAVFDPQGRYLMVQFNDKTQNYCKMVGQEEGRAMQATASKDVYVEQVIITNLTLRDDDEVCRRVKEVWGMDGRKIAESDPAQHRIERDRINKRSKSRAIDFVLSLIREGKLVYPTKAQLKKNPLATLRTFDAEYDRMIERDAAANQQSDGRGVRS